MEPIAATAKEARDPGATTQPLVQCGTGKGVCHLTALLSTTAAGESSQKAVRKKEPPDTPPQVRKKTRTLYRTDQLKELERMFQEDHYPDSDKRREIALAVGVTPQRIMVWFQNRRAKWRKVERLNSKGNKTNLEVPVSTSASLDNLHDSVLDFPSPQPIVMESGNFTNELVPPPVTFPPEPNLLMCDQPGALSQHNDEAQRVEVAPLLFSPPPVRRASLPLNLGPVHTPHLVPLLLETPNSGFSPKDGSSGSWETSITPGSTYNYSEQMESQYHHQDNQSRAFQLSHYSQHQLLHQSQHHLPQFHPFPFPLPQTLTPPPQGDPNSAALLAFAYGSDGETPTGLFSGPSAGQLLLQQPSGNLGPLTALQPIPWNDPCLPELSFPGSFCSQNFGSHSGGGSYIPDLAAHVLERQLSPGFIQLLGGSKTGSGLPSETREELSSGTQEHLSLPKEVRDGVKNTQLPRIAANGDGIPEKNED
ncbi:homeobox protein NOBOX isoform X1 [Sarcophilus harrisii]|uniref:NOBOX oosis homeobox n=1 Tax=Sarcophilus harrisii TaxID=9305 RepID=G3WKK9_SARHA|nr:homeobox protein NOBOX isoform X1 [Sarcophilus harrisii]